MRSFTPYLAPAILASLFPLVAIASLEQLQPESQRIFQHRPVKRVPVVLGVMSQCPDAMLCESVFDAVVQKTADKIDLKLTFIGRINATEPEYGVTCLHDQGECAGNIHELCVMRHEPLEQWWRFVQCENASGRPNIGMPETALGCAAEVGVEWNGGRVGACAGVNGGASATEGIQLLRESVKATKNMGITKSCTIIINGKQVCIRDGTWYSCDGGHEPGDFVRQIEEEYGKINGERE